MRKMASRPRLVRGDCRVGSWAALLVAIVPFGFLACVGDDPGTALSTDAGIASDVLTGPDAPGNDAQSAQNAAPGAPSNVEAAAVAVVATVSTLAGALPGFLDATGTAAKFSEPRGIAVDTLGTIYVADKANHRIRKVSPTGVVTTLAGTGATAFAEGNPGTATFFLPHGVAVNTTGFVYVADAGNNRIRVVTPSGIVSTLAGGAAGDYINANGGNARFFGPTDVALDASNNVYVSDQINQRLRFVTAAGDVSLIAGSGVAEFNNGQGAAAGFAYASGVAVSSGSVWLADTNNERIRKVSSGGIATTLAGSALSAPFADGTGAAATFNRPTGLALDAAGNAYIAESGGHRIRKVSPAGVVTTLAGTGQAAFADGPAASAAFEGPMGMAVDAAGNVYVCDSGNHRIRKIVTVGAKELTVRWNAPSSVGSSAITGYEATAAATGETARTCTTTGTLTCKITGLTSGVAYNVAVTASNAAGTSAASTPSVATPN